MPKLPVLAFVTLIGLLLCSCSGDDGSDGGSEPDPVFTPPNIDGTWLLLGPQPVAVEIEADYANKQLTSFSVVIGDGSGFDFLYTKWADSAYDFSSAWDGTNFSATVTDPDGDLVASFAGAVSQEGTLVTGKITIDSLYDNIDEAVDPLQVMTDVDVALARPKLLLQSSQSGTLNVSYPLDAIDVAGDFLAWEYNLIQGVNYLYTALDPDTGFPLSGYVFLVRSDGSIVQHYSLQSAYDTGVVPAGQYHVILSLNASEFGPDLTFALEDGTGSFKAASN